MSRLWSKFQSMTAAHRTALIGLLLLAVQKGATLIGYEIPDQTVEEVAQLIGMVLLILGAFGIVKDSGADQNPPK